MCVCVCMFKHQCTSVYQATGLSPLHRALSLSSDHMRQMLSPDLKVGRKHCCVFRNKGSDVENMGDYMFSMDGWYEQSNILKNKQVGRHTVSTDSCGHLVTSSPSASPLNGGQKVNSVLLFKYCFFTTCALIALMLSGFLLKSQESGLKERRGNPEPIDFLIKLTAHIYTEKCFLLVLFCTSFRPAVPLSPAVS